MRARIAIAFALGLHLLAHSSIAAAASCTGDATQLQFPLDGTYSVVPFSGAIPPDYRNDDLSSPSVPLGFTFDLYGDLFTSTFINNNGNVSFGSPFFNFTASGFPIGTFPMVAAFWADVDTRGAGSGLVYQKIYDSNADTLADTLVVTYDRVGYYAGHDNLLSTFQLAISDGTNPDMGLGNNVCFSWDNMCWTTGDASGGSGGFGGVAATVGANRGNGVEFFQIGRFDHEGTDYDGPFAANDGVSHLDSTTTCFNTSTTTTNIAPIATGFPPSNQLTVDTCLGEDVALNLQFLSPEAGQTTTVGIADPNGAQANGLVIGNTPGNVATVSLSWPSPVVGTYPITFTATDNFSPPGQTVVTLTLTVTCSAPICGNGALEQGEPCDGALDAACPGLCSPSCTCVACNDDADCSDGNVCTDDSCDLAGGFVCQYQNNTAPCSDGDFCTEGEICADGQCGGGTAIDCCTTATDCDDGNPCTDDTCDPSGPISICGHTPNTAGCDDGDACTTPDTCSNGTCQSGPPASCDDANPCTDDSCQPTGGCTNDRNTLCTPGCGDLTVGTGETCDPPNLAVDPVTSQSVCRLNCTACGDGNEDAEETCDDGNTVTGCRTDKPQKPNDACNNNCTQAICKDPARITLGPVSGTLTLHARLTNTEGRVLDVAGQPVAVRLMSRNNQIFSATLASGALAESKAGHFRYRNSTARRAGMGVSTVKVRRFADHYRITFEGFGTLTKATAAMTTVIEIGGERWSMEGTWIRTSKGWRLNERIAH